jgi:hypothetical protein
MQKGPGPFVADGFDQMVEVVDDAVEVFRPLAVLQAPSTLPSAP